MSLTTPFSVQKLQTALHAKAKAPGLAQRPGWDQIRAVKEQRICSFAPEVSDTIVRPGPRVVEGMRAIDDCLARVSP